MEEVPGPARHEDGESREVFHFPVSIFFFQCLLRRRLERRRPTAATQKTLTLPLSLLFSLLLLKQIGAVTSIDFCPASPHDFAVTASTRVIVHSGSSRAPRRVFGRFPDLAFCGRLRGDGAALAAGCSDGRVRLFDARSRALLRNLQGHAAACRAVSFGSGGGDAGGSNDDGDSPGLGSGRLSLASAGDDATVRTWDAASGTQTARLDGHQDYVRALAPSPSSAGRGAGTGIWASGGYDHLVKLWDVRASKNGTRTRDGSPPPSSSSPSACVATFDHGAPVEALAWLPGGALLASAGGRTVKLWDCLGRSRRPVAEVSCHQKTVSCLAAATFFVGGSGSGGGGGGGGMVGSNAGGTKTNNPAPAARALSGARLLTGSLDGHLRAFKLDAFTVTYSASYGGSPITALGVSPDGFGRQLAVGCSDGTLALRRRPLPKANGRNSSNGGGTFAGPAGTVRATRNPSASSIRRPPLDASHSRYFVRGANSRPRGPAEDTVIGGQSRRSRSSRRPGAVDRALRRFEHGEALDAAVASGRPAVVCALLDELAARSSGGGSAAGAGGGGSSSSALAAALGGRTPERLVPLLAFVRRHVSDPRYALPLAAVGHALADAYAPALGADEGVDAAVRALAARARAGARDAALLAGVRGAAEALRALAVVV